MALCTCGIVPVQVGLLDVELVVVVLVASSSHCQAEWPKTEASCLAAHLVGAVSPLPSCHTYQSRLGLSLELARLDEPLVLVGGVVHHHVHDHRGCCASWPRRPAGRSRPACRMRDRCSRSRRCRSRNRPAAKDRRREPDRVDAERLQVIQPRGDAVQVADAVAVGILKAARINLIDDGALPPVVVRIARCLRRRGTLRRGFARGPRRGEDEAAKVTATRPDDSGFFSLFFLPIRSLASPQW